MDFIPVSPIQFVADNADVGKVLSHLTKKFDNLSQQVATLASEKAELEKRVTQLEDDQKNLSDLFKKRFPEQTALDHATAVKRAACPQARLTDLKSAEELFCTFFDRHIQGPLKMFISEDYSFEETSAPGVFTCSIYNNRRNSKYLAVLEEAINKQLDDLSKKSPLTKDEIGFRDKLTKVLQYFVQKASAFPSPGSSIRRIIRGNLSGKLYSVPDNILQICMAVAKGAEKNFKFMDALGELFPSDVIVKVSSHNCYPYPSAWKFYFEGMWTGRVGVEKQSRFDKQHPRMIFQETINPGQLLLSEVSSLQESMPAPKTYEGFELHGEQLRSEHFISNNVKEPLIAYMKKYLQFKETATPGIFTNEAFLRETPEKAALLKTHSQIKSFLATGKPILPMFVIQKLVDALLCPSTSECHISFVLWGDVSKKWYYVPDMAISLCLTYLGDVRREPHYYSRTLIDLIKNDLFDKDLKCALNRKNNTPVPYDFRALSRMFFEYVITPLVQTQAPISLEPGQLVAAPSAPLPLISELEELPDISENNEIMSSLSLPSEFPMTPQG